MLLLSYPSIESFVISNFEENMYDFNKRFDLKGKKFKTKALKEYINDNQYDNSNITIETMIHSFEELVKSLNRINIDKINLDNTEDFNTEIFNYEKNHDNRYMLSLLLISFLDLGIIEFV